MRVSYSIQLASIDPKISSLDSRPQPSILQQDLLHSLPEFLMHPVGGRLISFTPGTDIPAIVLPHLHDSEKTHEVEKANQGAKNTRLGQPHHASLFVFLRSISMMVVFAGQLFVKITLSIHYHKTTLSVEWPIS